MARRDGVRVPRALLDAERWYWCELDAENGSLRESWPV
jgi:hypothetical protein